MQEKIGVIHLFNEYLVEIETVNIKVLGTIK